MESAVVISIRKNLEDFRTRWRDTSPPTICRAAAYRREGQRDVYEPTLVSIGPYNRDEPRLKPMEDDKWRCLSDFLPTTGEIMDVTPLVKAMEKLEPAARKCYAPTGATFPSPRDFAEMMLLDSCFIIGILLKSFLGGWKYICTAGLNFPNITADLLKLENQIPFFVLQQSYEILARSHSPLPGTRDALINLALNHLALSNLIKVSVKIPVGEIHHLLHLYHLCNVPDPRNYQPEPKLFDRICGPAFLCILSALKSCLGLQTTIAPPGRTAMELREYGVRFKAKKLGSHFLDIRFHKGTLEIPYQNIDPSFKAILSNILLFEQHSDIQNKYWTAHASFMDHLIDTSQDIGILTQSGIIQNSLSSADELATFFNQLAPNVILDPSNCPSKRYLDLLSEEMQNYCKLEWHKWTANLKRDYFSNPWSFISLLAAIILLVLTILQTVYTMKSYLQPPHSDIRAFV